MAEQPAKKIKIDQFDGIFSDFRGDKEKFKLLQNIRTNIQKGYSGLNVYFMKIKESNARACESFSNATCSTKPYMKDDHLVNSYSFGSLFSNGLAVLEKYIEDDAIPEEEASRKALQKLLDFIISLHTQLKKPKEDVQECAWTVQLAQNLFSKLAVGSKFTIDHHYQKKQSVDTCSCGKRDKLTGLFGNTSFGCPDAWYGSVDIYLENITVQLAVNKDQNVKDFSDGNNRGRIPSDSSDYGNESMVEVKTEKDMCKSYGQFLSQCIVFSFLQCKQEGTRMRNYLVPSIGVNTSGIDIFFYDSKNDVLMKTPHLQLFVNDILNANTVVCLWLAMNYRCFCTGVTENMKKFKAYFHDHIGEFFLKKYEEEVCRPVIKVLNDDFEPINWEIPFGEEDGNPVTLTFKPRKSNE